MTQHSKKTPKCTQKEIEEAIRKFHQEHGKSPMVPGKDILFAHCHIGILIKFIFVWSLTEQDFNHHR